MIIPEKVNDLQYQLIADIRLNRNTLVWQTPVLSLTGQAFLFVIAFGGGPKIGRLTASFLILITVFASIQLLAKHRYLEVHYLKLLESIERGRQIEPIHERPPRGNGIAQWSSYQVWLFVLIAFGGAAVLAAAMAVFSN